MRKLLLLFLLCAIPARAQYPYVPVVQSWANDNSGNSTTCAFQKNVVSGNYLIAMVSWESTANAPSFSDTQINSYTQKAINTANLVKVAIYTATAGSSGANTISVSITSGSFVNLTCMETLPNFSLTVDTHAESTFSGTPATITWPSITTTLNGDFIINYVGCDSSGGRFFEQAADFPTWTQVSNQGGADSQGTLIRIGGTNGAGNNITTDNIGTQGTMINLAFQSSSITINSVSTAPDGALSNAYDYTLLATGGAGAYTWSVTGGALQTGLSINSSTGRITGTPSSSSTNSITFQVTDGTHTTTKVISLKIGGTLNTITVVQTKGCTAGTNSCGLAFSSNVTSGNLLVISGGWIVANGTITECTDSLGTPFKTMATFDYRATSPNLTLIYIAMGFAPSTGADTVTCGSGDAMQGMEISNVMYSANDNTGFTTGNTASPATLTSNSLTTLVPNEIIYGTCSLFTGASTATVDAPFTVAGVNNKQSGGYRIVTTVTGYTMSCDEASNTDGHWAFLLAGLRPSAGATVATSVPRHTGGIIQ